MEILIPKFNIDISGKIRLQVFDQKGRTKNEQHFNNAIHDDLKNAFVNHLASSSASSHHINTSSNWFAGTMSHQSGKDGIYVDQSGNNTESQKSYDDNSGNSQWDMKLSENLSTTYGGGNSCTWQGEGTWTGGDGDPSNASGSFNAMAIGKGFSASSGGDPSFSTTFATATASGDFSAFTLDANDIARVTWTITIS